MHKVVISLFDYSGNMVAPWVEAGYEAYCLDLKHETATEGRLHKVRVDLTTPWKCPVRRSRIAMVFAFPPCDHLAISGSRWFKGKGLRKLAEAINLFATATEFCEWSGAPYMIENPVSTISSYWRKPDYIFHPHYFTRYCSTDNYMKRTCLWTGGGFIMPERNKRSIRMAPDCRIYYDRSAKKKGSIRDLTPVGFAKAVYESNAPT